MLARREDKTRCTDAWRILHHEYGLGRLVDNTTLHWTRDDLKRWQALVDVNRPAYEAVLAGADRTEVSRYTSNEKIAKVSIQEQRLFCHSINAPLYLVSGEQPAHPDLEYRVNYQIIDLNRYAAFLIIENQESYIYCQRFKWPKLPATLVLYRGHDNSAKAVHALLDTRKKSVAVYIFPDTDPSGLGIAMDMKSATHVIAPDVPSLDPKGLLRDRFATQLQRRPNLRTQASSFSKPFQALVNDVLQTGTAVSQEWLCAHEVALKLIPL